MSPFHINIFTLFPDMFPGPLNHSLAGKRCGDIWTMQAINIRDFAPDKHKRVDDAPYGGGPGMVLGCAAIDAALCTHHQDAHLLILLTPRGAPLTQAICQDLAQTSGMSIVCGRYEGIDERIIDKWQPRMISLGDFILSGAECAALALCDATIRLLVGIMGDPQSGEEESFAHDLLEYPHYTRPALWQDRPVPEVLLSGNHAQIAQWRRQESLRLTRAHRPDLWHKLQESDQNDTRNETSS